MSVIVTPESLRACPPLLWGMLVVCCVTGCGQDPSLETSRVFQSAESQFQEAASEADYRRAAVMYQEILDSGFQSGVVLYNQGNAWAQAGETGRAIASYRRAKRHLPRDPYLDANLRQVLAPEAVLAERVPLDYVFFWQQSVSYQEKAIATTCLLAVVLCSTLCVQLSRWRGLTRPLTVIASILTLLVGGSLARDWWDADVTVHGVIVANEVTARKGTSETYDPSFNQSLGEGTEFTVQEARGDWLNIQIGDRGEGWVRVRDCATW